MSRRNELVRQVLEMARTRRGVALMGICNVTPDSFSDGGQHRTPGAARARVDELIDQGADIVDVGGESTRPGAPAVSAAEQLERVLDVVRYAASRICVSIDTTNAEVAAACLDAGASAINDVSCLRDSALARVAAATGAALIVMHTRGTPGEMRGFSAYADDAYGDIVHDVIAEWRAAAARAMASGVPREALMFDPGLGFAKNARQSAELLRRVAEFVAAGVGPVVIGASRKSFLTIVDQGANPSARLGASIAAALFAANSGAAILRTHDVQMTAQALDMSRLLARAGGVEC